jgi:hypothetical protein
MHSPLICVRRLRDWFGSRVLELKEALQHATGTLAVTKLFPVPLSSFLPCRGCGTTVVTSWLRRHTYLALLTDLRRESGTCTGVVGVPSSALTLTFDVKWHGSEDTGNVTFSSIGTVLNDWRACVCVYFGYMYIEEQPPWAQAVLRALERDASKRPNPLLLATLTHHLLYSSTTRPLFPRL